MLMWRTKDCLENYKILRRYKVRKLSILTSWTKKIIKLYKQQHCVAISLLQLGLSN